MLSQFLNYIKSFHRLFETLDLRFFTLDEFRLRFAYLSVLRGKDKGN